MPTTVHELYQDVWGQARPGFDERTGTSLSPRDPDCLDEVFFKVADALFVPILLADELE